MGTSVHWKLFLFMYYNTHIDFSQGLNVRSSVLIIIMRNHWDIVSTDRATTGGGGEITPGKFRLGYRSHKPYTDGWICDGCTDKAGKKENDKMFSCLL